MSLSITLFIWSINDIQQNVNLIYINLLKIYVCYLSSTVICVLIYEEIYIYICAVYNLTSNLYIYTYYTYLVYANKFEYILLIKFV